MKKPPSFIPERFGAQSTVRPDRLRRRATAVVLLLSLWMVVIAARLVYLQTAQHEWLSARARAQQQAAVETSAARGLILDRHGRELVRSVDAESFFAVPGEIADIDKTTAQLASVIGIDGSKLAAQLKQAREANRKFTWVVRKLDAGRSARLRQLGLGGIHSLKEPTRHYPNGTLAAHVLGFVGMDRDGLAGVEQYYNAELVGGAGKLLVEGDARRRPYESVEVAARAGQSVVLTIDQSIQYQTERVLAATVSRARARAGTAIVLDPRTGEILALASAPTFDPHQAAKLAAEERTNEALQNIYEPGSTFKIVAFAAAIEEKLAQPRERIDCQMGAIRIAGRLVRDHTAFGTLTLTEALAKSSNVAAIKLGLRVGNERMYDYITRFGFGARTNIELPGETAGLLRPASRWQPSSIGSIAIGQEIGVTPLQMAAAFGALANDGVRIAPHLVRATRAADGTLVQRAPPVEHRVTSAETARVVRRMLESVTLKGTARTAQLDGYTAAGKTGTAQKIDPRTKTYSKTKHVASFAGFAPVENPSVVIVVVIDEPVGAYHGGDVAAPAFREIAESVLPYMNVVPDAEPKPPAVDQQMIAQARWAQPTVSVGARSSARRPQENDKVESPMWLPEVEPARGADAATRGEIVYAAATDGALRMPDLRGRSVRDAIRICAPLGLHLEARGDGRAEQQQPVAGASVEAGQVVRVDFGRGN